MSDSIYSKDSRSVASFDIGDQGQRIDRVLSKMKEELMEAECTGPTFRHALLLADACHTLGNYARGTKPGTVKPYLNLSSRAVLTPGILTYNKLPVRVSRKDLTGWYEGFQGDRWPTTQQMQLGGNYCPFDYSGGSSTGSGWLAAALDVHFANAALRMHLDNVPQHENPESLSSIRRRQTSAVTNALGRCVFTADLPASGAVKLWSSKETATYTGFAKRTQNCNSFNEHDLPDFGDDGKKNPFSGTVEEEDKETHNYSYDGLENSPSACETILAKLLGVTSLDSVVVQFPPSAFSDWDKSIGDIENPRYGAPGVFFYKEIASTAYSLIRGLCSAKGQVLVVCKPAACDVSEYSGSDDAKFYNALGGSVSVETGKYSYSADCFGGHWQPDDYIKDTAGKSTETTTMPIAASASETVHSYVQGAFSECSFRHIRYWSGDCATSRDVGGYTCGELPGGDHKRANFFYGNDASVGWNFPSTSPTSVVAVTPCVKVDGIKNLVEASGGSVKAVLVAPASATLSSSEYSSSSTESYTESPAKTDGCYLGVSSKTSSDYSGTDVSETVLGFVRIPMESDPLDLHPDTDQVVFRSGKDWLDVLSDAATGLVGRGLSVVGTATGDGEGSGTVTLPESGVTVTGGSNGEAGKSTQYSLSVSLGGGFDDGTLKMLRKTNSEKTETKSAQSMDKCGYDGWSSPVEETPSKTTEEDFRHLRPLLDESFLVVSLKPEFMTCIEPIAP